MQRPKFLFFILVLIFFSMLCGSFANNISQKLKDVYLVESEGKNKLWELWSSEASLNDKTNEWFLEDVKANFTGEKDIGYKLKSDAGKVNQNSQNIELIGTVNINATNGYQFETTGLFYKANSRSFDTSEKVKIRGPGKAKKSKMLLMGTGLKADLALSIYEINKRVYGQNTLSDGSYFTLRSHKGTIYANEHKIIFQGKVKATYKQYKIFAERGVALYDEKGQSIKTVYLFNNVFGNDKVKQIGADEIKINLDLDTFDLKGSPYVSQGRDFLKGNRILIENRGEKVKVFKALAEVKSKTIEGMNEPVKN